MPAPEPAVSPSDLDAAVAAAITACGGDVHAAVRALLVANAFLEEELSQARALISRGYARGRSETLGGLARTISGSSLSGARWRASAVPTSAGLDAACVRP